jgi:hypothetical protein
MHNGGSYSGTIGFWRQNGTKKALKMAQISNYFGAICPAGPKNALFQAFAEKKVIEVIVQPEKKVINYETIGSFIF